MIRHAIHKNFSHSVISNVRIVFAFCWDKIEQIPGRVIRRVPLAACDFAGKSLRRNSNRSYSLRQGGGLFYMFFSFFSLFGPFLSLFFYLKGTSAKEHSNTFIKKK